MIKRQGKSCVLRFALKIFISFLCFAPKWGDWGATLDPTYPLCEPEIFAPSRTDSARSFRFCPAGKRDYKGMLSLWRRSRGRSPLEGRAPRRLADLALTVDDVLGGGQFFEPHGATGV